MIRTPAPSSPAPASAAVPHRPVLGIALRALAVAMLGVMFALVKLAAARGVHVVESLFYRQAAAALVAVAWVALGPGFASLATRRPGAHALRMLVGLSAMALNFLAMVLLPLADATVIGFTVPIFATVLAALVLREPTGRWRWGAVALGFVGVLIVVRPGAGVLAASWGVPVALAGAGMTALVTILIRRLGATEGAPTVVFWFAVSSLVPMGALMLVLGRAHDPVSWGILALLGLSGGIAQLALTAALRFAPVAVVVPVDYTGLIWAALLGAALFGERVSGATWAGAAVIIASGLVIVWREQRLGRRVQPSAGAGTSQS